MFKRNHQAILSILIFLTFVSAFAQTIPGKYSSVPQFIRLDKTEKVALGEFNSWMAQRVILPQGNGFKLLSKERDQLGMIHYRYQQTINSIPVEGTMYIVHTMNGAIQSVNGDLLDHLSAPNAATVPTTEAINTALNFINASSYKWQSNEAEKALKENTGNIQATYYPQPELVYVAENNRLATNKFYLAYKMDVYASQPLSRNYVFVDAVTNRVIYTQNRIENADVPANAHTQYSGEKTITTDSYSGGYRLQEASRGNGIKTYNALQSTNPGNTDFTNATTEWNNVNAAKDQYATDAHFASEMTYDFYKNNFNRNSLDDNGLLLVDYVHYDQNLDNAFWDGGAMNYGDGSAGNGTTPYTTLDVGGHEITHGLTQYTAYLNYQDESGALNESFSDCMGISIRQYVMQYPSVHYLIGDDNGPAFRSMTNPKTYQQPGTYQGQYWATGFADNGGVHTNSGVQNHWFYILANGAAGTNDNQVVYNITGIGIEKAQAITYRNLTVYLTPTSQYADARTFSIQAAQDLYGACSPEVVAVANAWYAVGVGGPFNATVTSDFVAPITSSCAAPAAVSFIDASSNANTYAWDFGDGNTSSQQSPTHTYTTYGDFTVKLKSSSAACGTDSITKTALIHIADNRPTVTEASACQGTTTTLNATGSGSIEWYDASTNGNMLGSGTSLVTPVINQATTFYVQNVIAGPAGIAGPATQAIGAGGYNGYPHYTVFNNTKPQTLVSVLIDAQSAGNRIIELHDASNNVLIADTVNLVAGSQTVTLNFHLPAQNNLSLGIWNGTTNLYRNSAGASYPYYSTDSSVTITSNDVPDLARFYFFYNWQLQQDPCISERVPVNVSLLSTGCVSGISETEVLQNLSLLPNPTGNTLHVQLSSTESNNAAQLSVQNILGESLLTKNIQIANGSNAWAVDVSSFASGVYLFTLQSGKTTVTKRFVRSN